MSDEISKEEWINSREIYNKPEPTRREPKIDEAVSKIVGKKVFMNDPRLIKLVLSWKKNKPQNSLEPDNFLKDKNKVEELKKAAANW